VARSSPADIPTTVLLVGADSARRTHLGRRLSAEGFLVIRTDGPAASAYLEAVQLFPTAVTLPDLVVCVTEGGLGDPLRLLAAGYGIPVVETQADELSDERLARMALDALRAGQVVRSGSGDPL